MSASRARKTTRFIPFIVAVFGALMTASCTSTLEMGEQRSKGPAVKISFWTEPAPPRANQDVKLYARISGLPRDKAKEASVDFGYYKFLNYKPEGSVTDVVAQRTNSGEYVATARFDTATEWKVGVRVQRPGEEPVAGFFTVTVRPAPK